MKKQSKQATLQVRLSEDLAKKVDALAEDMDISRSQFIRRAINRYTRELEGKESK